MIDALVNMGVPAMKATMFLVGIFVVGGLAGGLLTFAVLSHRRYTEISLPVPKVIAEEDMVDMLAPTEGTASGNVSVGGEPYAFMLEFEDPGADDVPEGYEGDPSVKALMTVIRRKEAGIIEPSILARWFRKLFPKKDKDAEASKLKFSKKKDTPTDTVSTDDSDDSANNIVITPEDFQEDQVLVPEVLPGAEDMDSEDE